MTELWHLNCFIFINLRGLLVSEERDLRQTYLKHKVCHVFPQPHPHPFSLCWICGSYIYYL